MRDIHATNLIHLAAIHARTTRTLVDTRSTATATEATRGLTVRRAVRVQAALRSSVTRALRRRPVDAGPRSADAGVRTPLVRTPLGARALLRALLLSNTTTLGLARLAAPLVRLARLESTVENLNFRRRSTFHGNRRCFHLFKVEGPSSGLPKFLPGPSPRMVHLDGPFTESLRTS